MKQLNLFDEDERSENKQPKLQMTAQSLAETKRTAKQRWTNHDCRRYIENYIILHRHHQLPVQVVTAFWWDVPADRKARQQLESQLIKKWQSPFNKENWQRWGKLF